ncbi:hypothetical protein [Cupriavidus sp. D384]|uniref:hypothetical protein n=1 Tax=Cupriavidus sp. D384 TaxID=1538095 RepID=UPI0012E750E7|nr:hypothetical protein [Cupriavidus sp. D384]
MKVFSADLKIFEEWAFDAISDDRLGTLAGRAGRQVTQPMARRQTGIARPHRR